jgi:ABC-type sugar transport system substrate-binding protein/AraC-like DNA-binding protein
MKQLLAILVFLILLTACSGGSATYRIGVSQCSDDAWRREMNQEMAREAAFADGVELEFRTAGDDSRRQIADVEYFIQKRVDLLIIAPNEAKALASVVEKAHAHGIPVVVADRRVESTQYDAFVGADNYVIGFEIGNYIANRLQGKGKVVEITGLAGSTPAMRRHKGFQDALLEYPGIQTVAQVDGEWRGQTARDKMDSILRVRRDVDLVFAHNDRMAEAAKDALDQYPDTKHVFVVGIDALPQPDGGVQKVLDGKIGATFIYPTGGDVIMDVALRILRGESYKRETILPTALVDASNARLLQLQTQHIIDRDAKLEQLGARIDQQMTRYTSQRYLLYANGVVILLFIALSTIVTRAYWMRDRLNRELRRQKAKVEQQRDELSEQRDKLSEQRDQLAEQRDKLAEQRNQLVVLSQKLVEAEKDSEERQFVNRFRDLLEERLGDASLSVEALGEELGVSRVQLYRRIKNATQCTPVELLRMARLKRASELLATTSLTVSEIAYRTGFTSPSYFAKCYKAEFGKSPTEEVRKG